MRFEPEFVILTRPAFSPRDDDQAPVWQKGTNGKYTQRMVGRLQAEQRILDIVTKDRAELTARFQAMLDKVAEQEVTLAAQQAALASQQAAQKTILDQLATRKQVVTLPDVTVTANQLISLSAGERTFSNLPCAGILTTDTVVVTPKSMPVGTGIRNWSIPANGRLTLVIQCPILTVGGSALVVSVTAFR